MSYAAKEVLRRKLIALNIYIRKNKVKINGLSFHLMKLQQEKLIRPKTTRSKR